VLTLLLARTWLALWRWRVVPTDVEVPDRCVMIAAPHTSNWDFPLTLAIARVSGVRIQWLGKASLFRGPMGPLMRRLGGISIDRSSANGMVAALADELRRRERLVLVVPAEGTRSRGEHWKSGFYRIAQEAGVPIVCAYVDSATRTSGFAAVLRPTGDVRADMDRIRGVYSGKVGLRAAGTTTPRLREEEAAGAAA
jgi:1-acyl-sn-glycerol-3-phosphate acyltransferase